MKTYAGVDSKNNAQSEIEPLSPQSRKRIARTGTHWTVSVPPPRPRPCPGLTVVRASAARDRQLSAFIEELTSCTVTQQMYDEASFLRDPELASFLVQILASLHEYDLVLERSLTRGVKVGQGRVKRYRGRANQQPGRRS